jgi:hypothetical protein
MQGTTLASHTASPIAHAAWRRSGTSGFRPVQAREWRVV